jgi:hypothetical protein
MNLQRVTNFPAGVYEVSFSSTFTYSTTNRSAEFSWSIDGGTNWQRSSMETKDTTNTELFSYTFPLEHLGGGIDFRLDARCEGSSDTLDIEYGNIIFERKK